MASPKVIIVKESVEELRKVLKKSSNFISPRIRMLIELKKHETTGISKRELADVLGVSHSSIQIWRTMYQEGGLFLLRSHKKTGFKPSVFTEAEQKIIEDKLKDPFNGLRGYKELLEYIDSEFKKDVKYNTLLKFCIRKFGSSVKVARKSHIQKDENAVDAFKKTL